MILILSKHKIITSMCSLCNLTLLYLSSRYNEQIMIIKHDICLWWLTLLKLAGLIAKKNNHNWVFWINFNFKIECKKFKSKSILYVAFMNILVRHDKNNTSFYKSLIKKFYKKNTQNWVFFIFLITSQPTMLAPTLMRNILRPRSRPAIRVKLTFYWINTKVLRNKL